MTYNNATCPRRMPHGLDIEEVIQSAMDDEMVGYCMACGEMSDDSVEPDARGYHCSSCGEDQVFGAEEIVMAEPRPHALAIPLVIL